MKPATFEYRRASTLDHACELLGSAGDDAKILAGGQSLIAAMNFRLARPKVLIDVSHIADRNQVTEEAGGVRVLATTTQRYTEKHAAVQQRIPVLHAAIERIAHFQIRNKGTVGGSIVNADPASELPAMSLLLDAELRIKSMAGEQDMAAEDFFITYMTTALQADEVLASILFRAPPANCGWGFHEVARRSGDYAMAGSAALVALDGAGRCNFARLVLFGVAATPVRARAAEALLTGQAGSAELCANAARAIHDVVDPEGDVHATAAYRRQVAEVLAGRALRDAFDRAQAR